MSDLAWDGGEELVYDREDGLGEHTIDAKTGNIRVKDREVEIEVDCPQCMQSRSLELSWRDVSYLAQGMPVRPLHLNRGGTGFQAYVVCDECMQRLQEADDPNARQHATTVLTLTLNEIRDWAIQGKAAGRITPRMEAKAREAIIAAKRKRSARPPAAQKPQVRPQGRRIVRRRRGR